MKMTTFWNKNNIDNDFIRPKPFKTGFGGREYFLYSHIHLINSSINAKSFTRKGEYKQVYLA